MISNINKALLQEKVRNCPIFNDFMANKIEEVNYFFFI
jgi:hypothetical protein